MKTRTLAAACAGLVVAWTVAAFAEIQLALPADGRAMLERAIAALKADEASGLKAFNDEKNKDFRDRDLYVYCFSLPDGAITAYQSPVMIGTNVKELKIPPNNPVGQRAYDAVAKAAEGEIVELYLRFPQARHQSSRAKGNTRSPRRQAGLRRQLFQNVAVTECSAPRWCRSGPSTAAPYSSSSGSF